MSLAAIITVVRLLDGATVPHAGEWGWTRLVGGPAPPRALPSGGESSSSEDEDEGRGAEWGGPGSESWNAPLSESCIPAVRGDDAPPSCASSA